MFETKRPIGVDVDLPQRPPALVAVASVPGASKPETGQPLWVDPSIDGPDIRLVMALGPSTCVRLGVLPWQRCGSVTVVLVDDPNIFHRSSKLLEDTFGQVRIALCSREKQREVLVSQFGWQMALDAEDRAPAEYSCRNWSLPRTRRLALTCLCLLGALCIVLPELLVWIVMAWTGLTLLASTALKAFAIYFARGDSAAKDVPAAPVPAHLPVVSILVPLFKEREIASHLLARLERLDYPREKLDLCLILEEEDSLTREALEAASLPSWSQVITVPSGAVQTKPRALNYALNFAHGSMIGIYDAEDAPAPDQISKVVQRFAERGPDVACLQGVLDFYNTSRNWLSLCFTLEYAAWFRLVLPGLQRMGLVLPLGGTTLFLRRQAIEAVGGWDAHNVTEDAELGLRLARNGYRVEMIDTVTCEEANARAWPWVRQRSRWLKGYAMTWAVHNAKPTVLWRAVGPWRFLGVQVLYLATLSQFVLAPVIWTFWAVPFGLWHPMGASVHVGVMWSMAALFLLTEIVNFAAAFIATRRSGRRWLGLWAPLMHLYFPLATIAVYKALWEMVTRPFYWDKTSHGAFHWPAQIGRSPVTPPLRPLKHPV
ncbi:glycosyltransferase [Flavimaricola marinus]|uniref:Beta-monoglucosyldiacylglycerol synthase n=1 Tax=Flavimaricola marinus TaxID=1819565 RepID=A0A238LI35_9RHOB|nr:glycosyltransferase family 2 protein [Flavimaricola marinus]SMY09203.1 Beta-monoglucosyldiacylglycerol synthase [Flavimaricola marinus]